MKKSNFSFSLVPGELIRLSHIVPDIIEVCSHGCVRVSFSMEKGVFRINIFPYDVED